MAGFACLLSKLYDKASQVFIVIAEGDMQTDLARWSGSGGREAAGSSHLNAAFLSSSLEWPDRLNIEPVLGRGNIASEREGQSDCMSTPKLSQTTSYLDTGYLGTLLFTSSFLFF